MDQLRRRKSSPKAMIRHYLRVVNAGADARVYRWDGRKVCGGRQHRAAQGLQDARITVQWKNLRRGSPALGG